MPSTYQIFDKAEQLEVIASELYRILAERFPGDPEARAIFRRLQDEELQHAARVRLLKARYRHDSRLFPDAGLTAARLDDLLAEGRRVVADVAAGAWGHDLEVVKRALADLEARFGAAHAHALAAAAHPAVRELFEQLARQDEEHRRLLGG